MLTRINRITLYTNIPPVSPLILEKANLHLDIVPLIHQFLDRISSPIVPGISIRRQSILFVTRMPDLWKLICISSMLNLEKERDRLTSKAFIIVHPKPHQSRHQALWQTGSDTMVQLRAICSPQETLLP